MNGCKNKIKLNEALVNRIIKKVRLSSLTEESTKIVKSFYTSIDGKPSAYHNLVIDEYSQRKIVDKTKGVPIIATVFFEQKTSTYSEKDKVITISSSNADNIKSDTKYYALRQLFNYYLTRLDNSKEVSDTLAFLYFIAKKGFISIGHLKRINGKFMSEEINKHRIQLKQIPTISPTQNLDSYIFCKISYAHG